MIPDLPLEELARRYNNGAAAPDWMDTLLPMMAARKPACGTSPPAHVTWRTDRLSAIGLMCSRLRNAAGKRLARTGLYPRRVLATSVQG